MKTQDASRGGGAAGSKTKEAIHGFNRFTTISKRSNAMSTNKHLLGILALLAALILMMSVGYGQGNVTLSSDVIGTGTLNVSGDLTNKKGGNLAAGKVNMRGNSGTNTIANFSGAHTITFTELQFGRAGNKAIGTTTAIAVTTALAFGYASNNLSGTFSLGSNTLTIQDQSVGYLPTGTPAITFTSGTVKYTSTTAAQSIFSRAGGISYGDLETSGANKVTDNAITVNGTLTNEALRTVDFAANAFIGTGATFANSGTLKSSGAVTLGVGTTVNGTFEYAKGTAQSIADATYSGTLSLTGAGAKTVTNVVLGDVYTVAGGGRTYDGTVNYSKTGPQSVVADPYNNLTLSGSGLKTFAGTTSIALALDASVTGVNVDIASGTTTLAASATANFGGNLAVNGTFDPTTNAGTTVTFSGGAQTINGLTTTLGFKNLTLSGAAAKSSSSDLNVAGTFIPTQGIDMGSKTLNITNNAAGAVGAYGAGVEVIGKMQRAVTTTGTYVMNNSATQVGFTTAAPTSFALTVSPGIAPNGYAATTDVNRKVIYDYSGAWTTGTASLRVGYASSEITGLTAGNEAKLRYFEGSAIAANKIATGSTIDRTPAGAGFGHLTLAAIRPDDGGGITVSHVTAGSEILLSSVSAPFQTIVDNQTVGTTNTWDEGATPGTTDDIRISNIGITVGASVQVAAVTIDAAAEMSLTGGNLTASSVNNQGTLSSTGSNQLTVSGTFTNNNSNTNTFAGPVSIGTLTNTLGTLQFAGGTISTDMTVTAGLVQISGTMNVATAGQVTVNVNGGELRVNGTSGILNIGNVTYASHLSVNGTSTLTLNNAAGQLTVYGDLTIASGATLSNDGIITVGQ